MVLNMWTICTLGDFFLYYIHPKLSCRASQTSELNDDLQRFPIPCALQ